MLRDEYRIDAKETILVNLTIIAYIVAITRYVMSYQRVLARGHTMI